MDNVYEVIVNCGASISMDIDNLTWGMNLSPKQAEAKSRLKENIKNIQEANQKLAALIKDMAVLMERIYPLGAVAAMQRALDKGLTGKAGE